MTKTIQKKKTCLICLNARLKKYLNLGKTALANSYLKKADPQKLKKDMPDYVLLLAWNYADSIMKKEAWLKEKGVKFIIPIPKITII